MEFEAFKGTRDNIGKIRSILSVPAKAVSDGNCYGVLNFDFTRPDPLDKTDIAMAVVFGLLLGEELHRAGAAKAI